MLKGRVQCNEALINYRTFGQGADVVFIHGMATNHAFWRLGLLLPIARKYRVTVFDLRGHGNSSMPPDGYTTKALAEDLNRFLDQRAVSRVHLVGHSLGGTVALHFATLYPEKVRTITVADSRVRAIQPTNYARDWPRWDKAQKILSQIGLHIPPDEPEAGLWLLETMAKPEWFSLKDQLEGSSLAIFFKGMNGGRRAAGKWLELLNSTSARQDFKHDAGLTVEKLSSIDLPLFTIYGEYSSSLPSYYGLMEIVPHSRVSLLSRAGHFFPFTQAERFMALTGDFIQNN